jgi:hypothetical protein
MRYFLLLALFALAGCQSVPRVVVRATPSLRDEGKYDFSVEFVPEVSVRSK